MGYSRAGFDVVGVDIAPQPRYPFEFIQAEAIEYVKAHGHEYDAIHASPPCQAYTHAQRIMGKSHPDLVEPVRDVLLNIGKPYIIENVVGAPLIDPIELCGTMFTGLETYRHRIFETNWELEAPEHPEHVRKVTKMGRPPQPGEFMHVVGNFSGVARARKAMGINWMVRDELREAIPPPYTEFIGKQLMGHVANSSRFD